MASASQEWTTASLATLFHGLALSPADAHTLLSQTPTQINNLLRRLSVGLRNPPGWTAQRHTRAVLKRVTGISPPPKPRKKKMPKAPRHRISIQLIPATPADDDAVRAMGAYPFVEVVLKAGRRVWDVVRHLYEKWGLPVRVEVDGKVVCVDSLVCELLESGRTVRVPYRVVCVDIDWSVLKEVLDNGVCVNGKRRVIAPRDEALFTGLETVKECAEAPPEKCVHGGGTSTNGEEAVLSRLRGHLQKLESSQDNDATQNESEEEVHDDPAVILERFLRSCSRFEFAHSLPDSLLSLGRSDGSRNECDALQVMNDALDLRDEVDLRCDEQLDEDLLHAGPVTPAEHSLGLSTLFGECS